MNPTRAQELAVLRSVTYASLFDYPLTLAQLRESLVEVEAADATILSCWHHSAWLQSAIEHREGLFFTIGRADMISTRAKREALSRDLLHRDRRMFRFVAGMPFVRMVALSGSLAHLNAEPSADIDLFIITKSDRVWCVTVAALLIAKVMGWRGRLCLNYVISERQLAIAPADLFSANQIIHLRPVMGWATYQRFLDANPFVTRHYPNFRSVRPSDVGGPPWWRAVAEQLLSFGIAPLAERFSRVAYRWHLTRRSASWRSGGQVRMDDECLKLHTCSHREETMARFEAAVVTALAGGEARRAHTRPPNLDVPKVVTPARMRAVSTAS